MTALFSPLLYMPAGLPYTNGKTPKRSSGGGRSRIPYFPWTTLAFIGICTLLLPYPDFMPFVPAHLTGALAAGDAIEVARAAASMFSYMFLHADKMHFGANMFLLAMLGPSLERAFGHWRLAAFLVLCAFSGAVLHLVLVAHPYLPLVGASGAIFGLVVAWLFFAPSAVLFELPILRLPVRFYWLAALLFGSQAYGFLFAGGVQNGDPTSYAVHAGGALAGIMLSVFFLMEKSATGTTDSEGELVCKRRALGRACLRTDARNRKQPEQRAQTCGQAKKREAAKSPPPPS